MELFLVVHGARKEFYMEDRHIDEEDTNLVEANNEEKAKEKIHKMYHDKSDPYGEYYTGVYCYVKPTIR